MMVSLEWSWSVSGAIVPLKEKTAYLPWSMIEVVVETARWR